MRTEGQSIKLGDELFLAGQTRLEPFATTVSAIADFITPTKKARKSGGGMGRSLRRVWKTRQPVRRKTFLANLGDDL